MNKSNILIIIIIVFACAAGTYYWLSHSKVEPQQIACTQEAKICPDGSSVGRSGPKCEFAECPVVAPSTDSVAPVNGENSTLTDPSTGITYDYPTKLKQQFIRTQDWPPKITLVPVSESCKGKTTLVNSKEYCVTQVADAGAGNVYTTYTYTSNDAYKNDKAVKIEFIIHTTQCDNYDEPNKSSCKAENQAFDPDSIGRGIIMSLR